MGKGRLEAFSDGVIAVIITIMVLELKGRVLLYVLVALLWFVPDQRIERSIEPIRDK